MKKLIFRFYVISIIIAVILTVSISIIFMYFDTSFDHQVKSNLNAQSEAVSADINSEIGQKIQIVDDFASFVEINSNSHELLEYSKSILKNNSDLNSIYYGTSENVMINGSGWIPPEGFDLRTRPWYKKATEAKNIAITDVFLNASKDKWIITIAKPIFDNDNNIDGVVGADISIEEIINLVEKMNNEEERYLLIDGQRNIIASPYDVSAGIKLEHLSPDLVNVLNNENQDIVSTVLDGHQGYVLLKTIGKTNLTLITFISEDVYAGYHKYWAYNMIYFLILILLIFLGSLFLNKNIILKPLLNLVKDIESLPKNDDFTYRIPCAINDPCYFIRQSLNKVLSEVEHYFTDLNQSQEKLIESEGRNRAIISAMPDIILISDKSGVFLDCHTNNVDDLLQPMENFIGKNMHDILPQNIADKGMECIQEALSTGELQEFEYELSINNERKYFEIRIAKSTENEVINIIRDITFEKKEKDYILEISYKDHLSGLFNRRYFDEEIKKMDNKDNLPLAIAILDVNGLKLTNDAFGHIAGDELLKKVASTIQSFCPDNGFVARIGGDEFVLACPNCDDETVENLIDKFNRNINNEKINNIAVSVSAGWDVRRSLEQTIQDTFIKAENHMLKKKIVESQSIRNQTVRIIMQTLNEKSEREKRHSVEVSEWSRKIGEAMNLPPQMLKEIETAGLLHDIGKIAIREEILNKPGALEQSEYTEIKKHSESGYQILRSVDSYSSLAEYVLSHHERFDGKGYPRGIKGEEIPLIARIICVADAFEAMIADRPYRKGMSSDKAIDEIKRNSSTQFDPVVVECFLKAFEGKNI